MYCSRASITLFSLAFLATTSNADCAKDKDLRSNGDPGIRVTDFTITDTQRLNSAQVATLSSKLTGFCFNDSSDELEERIRILFQNRGFCAVSVKSVHIETIDPLAHPKTVTLEPEVVEGPRYRLAEIAFTGNHAFSTTRLRAEFPMKKGDLFERERVATGLDSLRRDYSSEGFIDFVPFPDVQNASDTAVVLAVSVQEGPRYRMGKLEVIAKKELAEQLSTAWQLHEGAIYDYSYVDRYIHANDQILPPGFTMQNVQLVRNCQDTTVDVRLQVEANDPAAQTRPKETGCEQKNDISK